MSTLTFQVKKKKRQSSLASQTKGLILNGRKLSPHLLITYTGVFPDRLEGGDYNNCYFLYPSPNVKTSDTH